MNFEKEKQNVVATESVAFDTSERMGTVEGKIRTVVSSLGVNYVFNDWTKVNADMDFGEYPSIIFVQPPSGNLIFRNNTVRDRPECQIAFLDYTTHDDDAVDEDTVVERMKRLCYRFIKAINDSKLFEPVEGNVRYQTVIDHLDQNVGGIIISPTLTERNGVRICDIENGRNG